MLAQLRASPGWFQILQAVCTLLLVLTYSHSIQVYTSLFVHKGTLAVDDKTQDAGTRPHLLDVSLRGRIRLSF